MADLFWISIFFMRFEVLKTVKISGTDILILIYLGSIKDDFTYEPKLIFTYL
jgi:hypothetical protein